MVRFLSLFKKKEDRNEEESYIEVTPVQTLKEAKVWIKIFTLKDFSEVKEVIDTLREGNTIVFVDIRYLIDREKKDFSNVKMAVNKIKRTVEAIGGDIIAIGTEWIIATPSFAQIYRKKVENVLEEIKQQEKV